ncbi:MAG: DUF58 domain-containing protein [Deltaproteobacteria bacterium]|nr:DUF58 domain-containing protein [Deltaproteobacteria bacterium]
MTDGALPRPVDAVSELLARRRFVELAACKPVDDFLPGAWESRRPGSGYEFDSLREMAPGDPVKLIDWSARARTGKLYVREFLSESYFNLVVVCDLSGSMACGRKAGLMAEIAISLAWSAISTGNPCGLLLFAEKPLFYHPPGAGREHLLGLASALVRHRPEEGREFAAGRASALLRTRIRPGMVFFISDFLEETRPADLVLPGCEVKAIQVLEESEKRLPRGLKGLVACRDPEDGREYLLDLEKWRDYNRQMADYLETFEERLRHLEIAATVITPADDFADKINRMDNRL